MKPVAPFLLAFAVLGTASVWLEKLRETTPLRDTEQNVPQPTTDTVMAVTVPIPDKTASTDSRRHELELPDGSFVPTLNGALDAAPLQRYWSAQRPWSPIVGVERSEAGIDWYRHADGSYSTTQMVWRSDLGREDAMTRVAHPGPEVAATAPMRD